MSLTDARLTEAAGIRGLEAGSNRVREDYVAGPGGVLFTDTFTYSDGALPTVSGGLWTGGVGTCTVLSGVATGGNGDTEVYITAGTSGNDQWAEADIPSGDYYSWVSVRIDATITTRYYMVYARDNNNWALGLRNPANPFGLTLATGGTNSGAGTHRYRVEAEGTTIRGYLDGVKVAEVTDTNVTTGKPGIGFYRPNEFINPTLDNFRGGDLPYTPPTFAPSDLSGLRYWYNTDDGTITYDTTVTTWPVSLTSMAGYGPTLTDTRQTPSNSTFGTTTRGGRTIFNVTGGNNADGNTGFRGLRGAITFTGTQYSVFTVCELATTADYCRLFSLSRAGVQDWNDGPSAAFYSREGGFPSIVKAGGQVYISGENHTNAWACFGIVVNGGTVTFYKDGVNLGSTGLDSTALNPVWLGLMAKGDVTAQPAGDSWRGKFGELCFYDRVLTAPEIAALSGYMVAAWPA